MSIGRLAGKEGLLHTARRSFLTCSDLLSFCPSNRCVWSHTLGRHPLPLLPGAFRRLLSSVRDIEGLCPPPVMPPVIALAVLAAASPSWPRRTPGAFQLCCPQLGMYLGDCQCPPPSPPPARLGPVDPAERIGCLQRISLSHSETKGSAGHQPWWRAG